MAFNYTDEILAKLHTILLRALKEFDRICRKYEITYFVGFGTAIGAARHKGFIPWDDDVDLCMMREEYEKLCQVPKEEWAEGYFLGDPRDGYQFHRTLFSGFYIAGTAYETDQHVTYFKPEGGENYPIRLDIFLFDYFDVKKLHRMIRGADNYKRLLLYSVCKSRVIPTDPLKIRITCRIKRTISSILKATGWDAPRIYNAFLKYLEKNKGEYITGFDLVEVEEKEAFVSKYDELFPVVYLDFEDMKVPINKNYREVMTKIYEDYMKMPPKWKQKNGSPAVLDFGDGKGNVFKTQK